MEKILIVEDDKLIAELERDYFEASGFQTDVALSGNTGLQLLLEGQYDGAVLDVMLPGMDGFQICREARKSLNIPILLVTARKEEVDKIRGLGLGADDYIEKPFSPMELVARLKAHMAMRQRLLQENIPARCIEFQTLKIVPEERRVYLEEKEVALVNKEYELLLFLAENPNIAFSKETLFDRVWGMDSAGSTSTVTVHINRLREKIDKYANTSFIDTVWGVGYRFRVKN